MNYELAKELKDAGFIVEYPIAYKWDGSELDKEKFEKSSVKVPSLSELIESCNPMSPDEFVLNTCCGYWEARWNKHTAREEDDKQIEIKGATPEEVVARLWLALNKKV